MKNKEPKKSLALPEELDEELLDGVAGGTSETDSSEQDTESSSTIVLEPIQPWR